MDEIERLRAEVERLTRDLDEAVDLIGRTIMALPSGQPEEGGLRQLKINDAVKALRARAEAAERQVAILREALRPLEAEYYKTHKVIPALASRETRITLTIEAAWLHAVHAALAATETNRDQ